MSRLDDAARSVPADSSSADEDTQETQSDLELETNAAGDADDSKDQQDGDDGRTIENVRGELLRKMEQSNEKMLEMLSAIREDRQEQSKQYGVPTTNTPKTLDDLSISELETMRNEVPEEKLAAFNAYFMDRKVDARVDNKLSNFQSESKFNTDEQKFNQQAFDRWPDLHNKKSEFYAVADRILGEMGPNAEKNARAVFDAANDAGHELGVAPRSSRNNSRIPPSTGRVVSGRSSRAASAPEDGAPTLNQKSIDALADVMPGRKFTKEQLKRIAKRDKQYRGSINTRVRG